MEPIKMVTKNEYAKLSKQQLIDYTEFMHKSFWNLQGNWMLNVNKRYGAEVAVKFDEMVFGRISEVQAMRLKTLFNLGDTIQDFMKALALSTMWEPTGEWEYVEFDDKHVIARVNKCPMQLARLKLGIGELACKAAGLESMIRFAAPINPKLKASCIVCPPDKHPENIWCEWLWELSE